MTIDLTQSSWDKSKEFHISSDFRLYVCYDNERNKYKKNLQKITNILVSFSLQTLGYNLNKS